MEIIVFKGRGEKIEINSNRQKYCDECKEENKKYKSKLRMTKLKTSGLTVFI